MLKILKAIPYFAPAYSFGGPVIQSLNISKIQASLGYDVRVFTTNIYTNETISKDFPKYEILDGVKIHRYSIRYRLNQSQYFVTPKLLYGFLKYEYDIIHSHMFRTFQTDVSTIFSKLKKKPFVFTAHGSLRDITLFNWFKNKKKEARRIKFYDSLFKKYFVNLVDSIIVHSKYEKFWTMKNGVPKKKIKVIPPGVNLEIFSDTSYRKYFLKKFNIKEKMILCVARLLRDYRNLDHLIKIMKDIIKEIKDVKLWIIGSTIDKDYEIELKKMVKEWDLTKYIKFITIPTRADIIGAYQTADVFVFPITNSDSFGIPLIESGAAKCPVISINQGPAPEIIKNGYNGILTEKNDLSQLKEAISKILTDEVLNEKMGLNGYENVVKNYTWEVITKKTNDVYAKLI